MRKKPITRSQGFTLLELMIVVIIISLLAALAIPSYFSYVQRTRRSDGQSALLNATQAEEKFFYRCNRYGSLQEIYGSSTPTCTSAAAVGTAIDSPQLFYSITLTSIAGGTNPNYVLQAAPQGRQANDPCGNLTLTSTGVKTSVGPATLRCWN
jgi:type IV pilus assembly protein PilE